MDIIEQTIFLMDTEDHRSDWAEKDQFMIDFLRRKRNPCREGQQCCHRMECLVIIFFVSSCCAMQIKYFLR